MFLGNTVFLWVLFFIKYRAYSINSSSEATDDVTGLYTMNVEGWGQRGIHSNSGNSPLLSLDCDMTEEDNAHAHAHNNQSQTNHWFAQIPWAGMRHLTRVTELGETGRGPVALSPPQQG